MDIKKKRQCPQMPAGFFMNVKAVTPYSGQSKAIVVSFAHMEVFRVRPYNNQMPVPANLLKTAWVLPEMKASDGLVGRPDGRKGKLNLNL